MNQFSTQEIRILALFNFWYNIRFILITYPYIWEKNIKPLFGKIIYFSYYFKIHQNFL